MTKQPSNFFCLSVKLWDLFIAAGWIASAATLLALFGRFSRFLDLFSHFRVQYLIYLSIIGLILLVRRYRKTAVIFIGLACVNLFFVLPLYFGKANSEMDDLPVIRAMLLNVNTKLGDVKRVKEVINDIEPDIIVLEEISAKWISNLASLTNSHPYTLSEPRYDNFGIGIFSKFPITKSEIVYIRKARLPSILATVNIGQTNLVIIATHPLPPIGNRNWSLRNEQLKRIPDYIPSDMPVILLGDLNTTPWNYFFRKLLKDSGLKDSAQGFGVQPSWPNFNPLMRIPLDHCLHSPDIKIVDRRIGADVASDHYPLIIDFVIEKKQLK